MLVCFTYWLMKLHRASVSCSLREGQPCHKRALQCATALHVLPARPPARNVARRSRTTALYRAARVKRVTPAVRRTQNRVLLHLQVSAIRFRLSSYWSSLVRLDVWRQRILFTLFGSFLCRTTTTKQKKSNIRKQWCLGIQVSWLLAVSHWTANVGLAQMSIFRQGYFQGFSPTALNGRRFSCCKEILNMFQNVRMSRKENVYKIFWAREKLFATVKAVGKKTNKQKNFYYGRKHSPNGGTRA